MAVALSVLMGTITGVAAAAPGGVTGPANRAFIDMAATTAAQEHVTSLSEQLFTFSHTDLKAHEVKFVQLTTGDFGREYGKLFNTIITQARQTQLSLTSRVTGTAVRDLRGETAEVIVFLEQTSTRADTGAQTVGNAVFRATITRVGDAWKVAGLDLYGAR